MKSRHWSTLAAAAAMATVIGGAAMAQGPGRMMDERDWGMRGMGWGMWRGGPWQRGPDAMLDRVEGRLAFIMAELKISEAQTPAWNAPRPPPPERMSARTGSGVMTTSSLRIYVIYYRMFLGVCQ